LNFKFGVGHQTGTLQRSGARYIINLFEAAGIRQ
jgi:hypothetical protein